jgi:hypothetical protein
MIHTLNMKYDCKYCDYTTTNAGNWHKHLSSKKHAVNEVASKVKNSTCFYCRKIIPPDEIMLHYAEECNILIKLETEIVKLNNDNKKLTDEMMTMLKESNAKLNDNTATLIESNKSLAASEHNAMNFLTQNFTQTQALKCITYDEAYELLTHDKTIEDIDMDSEELEELTKDEINDKINDLCVSQLVFEHNNDNLHTYITNIIAKEYTTEKPEDQRIWNTDKSRLSYIVREVMNKKNEWIKDDKGKKVNEYVIEPFLKTVEDMITSYVDRLSDVIKNDKEDDINLSTIEIMTRISTATGIIKLIRNKKLNSKIVTEMTKHFGIYNVKKFSNSKKPKVSLKLK